MNKILSLLKTSHHLSLSTPMNISSPYSPIFLLKMFTRDKKAISIIAYVSYEKYLHVFPYCPTTRDSIYLNMWKFFGE